MSSALDKLEEIADPVVQAREISEVLKNWPERVKRLKEIRRRRVLEMRDQKVSFRKIAADLGISSRAVQDIVSGYSGSGRDRPRKKAEGESAE